MIKEAFSLVSNQPLLLPLYRSMIEAVIASMPNTRQFETVLEQTFNSINKDLQKTEIKSSTNVENLLAKTQQEKNALKSRELDIKAFSEAEKARINQEELELKKEQQQSHE